MPALTTAEVIFIRLATKLESNSNHHKRNAFNAFPARPGYEVAYKPYGEQGRGFYYVPTQG